MIELNTAPGHWPRTLKKGPNKASPGVIQSLFGPHFGCGVYVVGSDSKALYRTMICMAGGGIGLDEYAFTAAPLGTMKMREASVISPSRTPQRYVNNGLKRPKGEPKRQLVYILLGSRYGPFWYAVVMTSYDSVHP